MNSRLKLHELLTAIDGVKKVYFQPPASVKMVYPCIVYSTSKIEAQYANNFPYAIDKSYTVMVIDTDPDSKIPDEVVRLSKCAFDRHYTSNNLNYYVFKLYF